MTDIQQPLSSVAYWRITLLRVLYLLIAIGLSSFVWKQLFFEATDWSLMRGVAKSMMGAIAILSFIGIFHPLKMLPLLLFETLWKTLWLLIIALPAWNNNRWNADIEYTFYECIGIIIAYLIIPWPYVWKNFIKQMEEPLTRK